MATCAPIPQRPAKSCADRDTARAFENVNGKAARGGSMDAAGPAVVLRELRLWPVGWHARESARGIFSRRKVADRGTSDSPRLFVQRGLHGSKQPGPNRGAHSVNPSAFERIGYHHQWSSRRLSGALRRLTVSGSKPDTNALHRRIKCERT